MAEKKSENSSSRKPFAYVSDSLHKVDVLLNSTREDLVKRLREGSNVLEERKRRLFPEQSQYNQQDGLETRPALPKQKREFRPPKFKRDREYEDTDAQSVLATLSRTPGPKKENAVSLERPQVTFACVSTEQRLYAVGSMHHTDDAQYRSTGKCVDGKDKPAHICMQTLSVPLLQAPQTTVQKPARLPFQLLVEGDLAEAEPVRRSKQAWQRTLENCQDNWSTLALRLQQRLPSFGHPQLPKGRCALHQQ